MAGHSKWANIKHKKAKVDAQKGVVFAKYSREITIAAKAGGANPEGNFRLRTAIEKAKAAGIPNDNIKRSIEKVAAGASNDNLEEIVYEGYGPGGIAILIETMTDNRNRTAGDIRSYFNKNQGNLGEAGCVDWMFKEEGVITIQANDIDNDIIFDHAINAGATDFTIEENIYKITTNVDELQEVSENIEALGYKLKDVEITRNATNIISIDNPDNAKYLLRLLDSIENHDDVQNVYTNFEIEDELLEKLG